MARTKVAGCMAEIIHPVNTTYGCPMGRVNVGSVPTGPVKVYDRKVPMIEPGYDLGGAYWGIGRELRVRFTSDLTFIEFYRA